MITTAFPRITALAAILAIATAIQAQGPRNIPFNGSMEVPLYEDFPVIEDYRLNQSIQGAIRWGTLAPFVGAAFGALMLHGDDGAGPYRGAILGSAIGIPLGATLGYFKGKTWEDRQAGAGGFHAPRLRIGYELEAGGSQSSTQGGFAMSYRLPVARSLAPNEFQLSYQQKISYAGKKEAHDTRYSIRLLKTFRDKLVNPYAGFAVGYADGYFYEPGLFAPGSTPPEEIQPSYGSAFVDVMAGLKLNVFDLAHLKTQVTYEPYGPYYAIRDEGNFSYLSNFSLNVSLGTYIF